MLCTTSIYSSILDMDQMIDSLKYVNSVNFLLILMTSGFVSVSISMSATKCVHWWAGQKWILKQVSKGAECKTVTMICRKLTSPFFHLQNTIHTVSLSTDAIVVKYATTEPVKWAKSVVITCLSEKGEFFHCCFFF